MATSPSQQLAGGLRPDQPETEFAELYDNHCEGVFRFCLRRLGDREDAADAVQDTYAKAWLALRDGCLVREPVAWLLTIAANVCASRYRASRARPTQAPLTDDAAASVTPLTSAELSGLPAALRALPAEQRHVFVLRELRGCSYDEIGDAIGASQASVAGLLHRARRSVAASLTGAGRKVMVALPFPSVLRSAFEGGGAVVAATAAVTAAGTLALIGPSLPHLGDGGDGGTPALPAASAPGTGLSVQPLAVAWSFQPPVRHNPRGTIHRGTPSPRPAASSTRTVMPLVGAAPSSDSSSAVDVSSNPGDASRTTPAAGSDRQLEAATAVAPYVSPEQDGEAPDATPSSTNPGASVNGHGDGVASAKAQAKGVASAKAQAKGVAGAKAQANGVAGAKAQAKGVAGAKAQGNGVAGAKAQGNGPNGKAVAGAKAQGNAANGNAVAGAKAQGNAPNGNAVAGAKAQGNAPNGNAVAGAKAQGNGPPVDPGAAADPGPQASGDTNAAANGNANGHDNGNGHDPGQGGQSNAGGNGGGHSGNPHDG